MSALREALRGERPMLFFGAGQNAAMWISHLQSRGAKLPDGVIDETPGKQGTTIQGVPILTPAEALRRLGGSAIVLVTVFVPGIAYRGLAEKVRGMGFAEVRSVAALLAEAPGFPFYYFDSTPPSAEAEAARKRLEAHWVDPISRRHVDAFRASRELDPSLAASPGAADYFLSDCIRIPEGAIYADIGAYRGDTLQRYFARPPFKASRVVAMEPDPANFAALVQYVGGLPASARSLVQLEHAAAGSSRGTLRFQSLGNPSSRATSAGGIEVKQVKLDDLLDRSQAHFIKFDVEGAELDALGGSTELVAAGRSALAVSVYHGAQDWLQVSQRLLATFPGAQLYFRTFDENGMDSMIYAVPRAWRLLALKPRPPQTDRS